MYYRGDCHQGDYYQGDYYQGDPFIGALLGSVGGWIGKKIFRRGAAKVPGTLARRTGGLVGPMLGGALAGRGVDLILRSGAQAGRQPFQIPMPGGGVFRPGRILPGGVPATSPGYCPTGFHFNKSMTSSGAPPGTVCVKNRRMNVANPQALRRSLRRVAGFGKLAMRAKRDVRRAAKSIGA